jgi:hypothetical protein
MIYEETEYFRRREHQERRPLRTPKAWRRGECIRKWQNIMLGF